MSPFLPQTKAKDLVRVAKQLGFELDRQKAVMLFFTAPPTKHALLFPCMPVLISSQRPNRGVKSCLLP